MEITYQGEHLWIGNLGYFFVVMAFGAAILAFIAYLLNAKTNDVSWKRIGRISFIIHGISVIGTVSTMAYLMKNRYYEFHYVWSHVSNNLPDIYLIPAFWEGQEGSFLLWSVFHVLLGFILIKTAKTWESPVIMIMSLAQIMLSAMLLGLDIWGDEQKELGMNFFRLLRTELEAPIFSSADYLKSINDGTGLNPLLQNYWNIIHPPVLFLGFALTIVPFAYVTGGLITKRLTDWVKPTLGWTGVTVGVLGLGILMGGAWAYEALTFGGFWAWDPVENAVLVPWLLVTAGLHTLVIYKNTGKSLVVTMIMLMAGFILILYSTFLTRSGVLGDTSVHSFTDLGLSGQLLVFLLSFTLLGIILVIYRYKNLKSPKSDDDFTSRELWMLIGSLALTVSAFQIIFSTSIPVINKVVGWFVSDFSMAPPTNAIEHYHKFQIPFGILIALLTAAGQYFKYRKSPKSVWKKIVRSFIISVPLSIILILGLKITDFELVILLLVSVYAIVGNLEYLYPSSGKKTYNPLTIILRLLMALKSKYNGASIAHIGLGLLLLGALISNGKKQVVSRNVSGTDFGDGYSDLDKVQNVLLPKGKPVPMGGYVITFHGDSLVEPNHYYKVEYKKIDNETGKTQDRFYLYPKAQINDNMGLVPDPSIKRTFGWDLYTHITSVPTGEEKEEWSPAVNQNVAIGDTIKYRDAEIVVGMINLNAEVPDEFKKVTDSLYVTTLDLSITKGGETEVISPYFIIQGTKLYRPAAYGEKTGVRAFFVNINRETKDFEISLSTKNDKSPDYIIMKAMVFPWINILWLGCVLLFIGSLIAAYRRFTELNTKS
ncbi:MAG: cytochrome c biogenesis protein CcsA [Bacteroidia bacterium]